MTSLTVNESALLASPCEVAVQAHMARWRLDGKPRIARRYTTDKHCPVPTPEDRELCILVYLQSLSPPGRTRAAVRDGPEHSASVDPRAPGGAASVAAHAGGYSDPVCGRAG